MLTLLLICVLIGAVVKLGFDLNRQESTIIVDALEHDEAEG